MLDLDDDIARVINVDDRDTFSTCAEGCPIECIVIEKD